MRDVSGRVGITGLTPAQRAATPLWLAVHGHPGVDRMSEVDGGMPAATGFAAELSGRTGLGGAGMVHTCACVSASTAVADADLDRTETVGATLAQVSVIDTGTVRI
jgi:hypothetical protein